MSSAFRPTKLMPWLTSYSWSAAVASPEVTSSLSASVIFSTPHTMTTLWMPLATAMTPTRSAAEPEAHAASTFIASMPRRPMKSATSAPRCSWPLSSPESMLPTYSASAVSMSASRMAATIASWLMCRSDRPQCSSTRVCPIPIITTSLIDRLSSSAAYGGSAHRSRSRSPCAARCNLRWWARGRGPPRCGR